MLLLVRSIFFLIEVNGYLYIFLPLSCKFVNNLFQISVPGNFRIVSV